MAVKRWLILLLILTLPPTVGAQVEQSLEQWMEETEDSEAAADLGDLLQQLQDNPVNINDTAALAVLPLLSPFQYRALANYILLHGQLLSLKELRFIPGFDSATVQWLEQVATAAPFESRKGWRLSHGHHRLVAGLGGTAERAEGYRNGHYEGDNLRALLCYTYTLPGHIDLRLTADKDPAEAWGKANYYGYHLMLSDMGPVERLIVGRYNLQFGQGLTLWTGLRPFNLTGMTPLRFGAGIRPASAFYEEGYQEGVAARVRLSRRLRLSAFGSHTDGENLAGTHLDYRHGNLVAGLTAACTLLDDSLATRDYVYNQLHFRGRRQCNIGADVAWQWQRLTLYGEAAIGKNGAPAAIGGMLLQADSRNRFGVSYRFHHRNYHNLHAQGYAIGSTQGEQGVTLDAESRLPLGMTLTASLDAYSFPTLHYANYRPSAGSWLRLQLCRQWGPSLVSTLRYAYRQKERNIPNLDSTLYLGEETVRQQLQGEVAGSFGPWNVKARGILARFDSDNGQPQQGWLANLTARYSLRRLQVTAAATWFDVDGYYARIYLGESNLQYAWSMPALYGRGLRAWTVARWRLSEHLTVGAKYAITYMPSQEAIGSGDSRTHGPTRQTWFLQLRCAY